MLNAEYPKLGPTPAARAASGSSGGGREGVPRSRKPRARESEISIPAATRLDWIPPSRTHGRQRQARDEGNNKAKGAERSSICVRYDRDRASASAHRPSPKRLIPPPPPTALPRSGAPPSSGGGEWRRRRLEDLLLLLLLLLLAHAASDCEEETKRTKGGPSCVCDLRAPDDVK